jgi:hypothetical protein
MHWKGRGPGRWCVVCGGCAGGAIDTKGIYGLHYIIYINLGKVFLDWLFFLEENVFKTTSLSPKAAIQGTSPGATRLSALGATLGTTVGASPRAGLAVGPPLVADDLFPCQDKETTF